VALNLTCRYCPCWELPIPDGTADLVWCKEVLMYADLDLAFGEFVRVLRPNGVGLVYQVLTGPRMSDVEAHDFWEADLGYGHAQSLRPSDIEAAIASVGLKLRQRIDFASEWGEYAQERSGAGGRRLVHAARLLRDPQRYTAAFGEAAYRIMLSDCLWHVYRMIGKLHGAAFIFTKPG
jgi:SAM-dependent methyltransferase